MYSESFRGFKLYPRSRPEPSVNSLAAPDCVSALKLTASLALPFTPVAEIVTVGGAE